MFGLMDMIVAGMEKVESALDVLSRAATMVQPCPAYPASDSDSFGKYFKLILTPIT